MAVEAKPISVTHTFENAGTINHRGLTRFTQQNRGMTQLAAHFGDHAAHPGEQDSP
jgi:hypothetical protein